MGPSVQRVVRRIGPGSKSATKYAPVGGFAESTWGYLSQPARSTFMMMTTFLRNRSSDTISCRVKVFGVFCFFTGTKASRHSIITSTSRHSNRPLAAVISMSDFGLACSFCQGIILDRRKMVIRLRLRGCCLDWASGKANVYTECSNGR